MGKERTFICDCGRLLSWVLCFQLFLMVGCGRKLSTSQEIEAFKDAGVIQFGASDMSTEPDDSSGLYRVIPGDVLEFQMPAELRIVSSNLIEWDKPVLGKSEIEPYIARVDDEGSVTLPIIGKVHVWGSTLPEIETVVKNSYYPKYVVKPPQLVCQVRNYQNENKRIFAVMGLVQNPGTFSYPPDVQYSLMEALAFAGGLDMIADPRFLQVYRTDEQGEIVSATFSVDSQSFRDAAKTRIKPGDVIYVDHTLRTRTNQFLNDVFHITVGAGVDVYD